MLKQITFHTSYLTDSITTNITLSPGVYTVTVTDVYTIEDLPLQMELDEMSISRTDLMAMVRGLLFEGRKIPAIKLVCKVTDWRLRDGKFFIDNLIAESLLR